MKSAWSVMHIESRIRQLGIMIGLAILTGAPLAALGHIGSPYLPEGCGSCHVGHGEPGEPLLNHSEEEACFQCHGSDEKRSRMVRIGKLSAGADLQDLEREFRKISRHPVREGIGHSPDERLPEEARGRIEDPVGAGRHALRLSRGIRIEGAPGGLGAAPGAP